MIYVIKKDGTKEEFNPQKIVAAVNKSAARILYTFSQEEKDFICRFAQEHADSLGKNEIQIQEMHNIVEGALERVNPAVAKSYRDYRNYKLDFIHMMDDVYTKSQAIRYIGDKSNANTDSALVATKRSLIFNELNKELYRKFFLIFRSRFLLLLCLLQRLTGWLYDGLTCHFSCFLLHIFLNSLIHRLFYRIPQRNHPLQKLLPRFVCSMFLMRSAILVQMI